MTRHKAPTVRVVGEHDEPYLLVRAESAEQARELAHAYLVEQGDGELWDSFGHPEPPPVNAVRDGWWRWVPARPGAFDYSFWLHSAEAGTRGAFHAWEVEIGNYPARNAASAGAA